MASTPTIAKLPTAKSARLTLNPERQNIETIQKLVATILNRAGCEGCGRLSYVDLHFQGDPGPVLAQFNLTSIATTGF